MEQIIYVATQLVPCNKGQLAGQKTPLMLQDIWVIRVRPQTGNRTHELDLFNLAIDSKLTSCDLVMLSVRDVCHGSLVVACAMVVQQAEQQLVRPLANPMAGRRRDQVAVRQRRGAAGGR